MINEYEMEQQRREREAARARKVYLAGPITGTRLHVAANWREDPLLHHSLRQIGWKALSPLDNYEGDDLGQPLSAWFEGETEARMAVTNDLVLIRQADAVLLNLLYVAENGRVSIGSMCELGYAHGVGKPIVTVRGDDDLYSHPFIEQLSTVVVPTLQDGLNVLEGLYAPAYA